MHVTHLSQGEFNDVLLIGNNPVKLFPRTGDSSLEPVTNGRARTVLIDRLTGTVRYRHDGQTSGLQLEPELQGVFQAFEVAYWGAGFRLDSLNQVFNLVVVKPHTTAGGTLVDGDSVKLYFFQLTAFGGRSLVMTDNAALFSAGLLSHQALAI